MATNLTSILQFVHMHAPEMHRIDGDCVLAAAYVSVSEPTGDLYVGDFCELAEIRTMCEARDWLGY